MLTVRYDRLGVQAGDRVLDLGSGPGRHAFEAYRRGARVVAFDLDRADLKDAAAMFAGQRSTGEAPDGASAEAVNGDALALPFADGSFDRIIAAEVLEHIPQDRDAIAELSRVLRPGGTMAVTVPRFYPELVNWTLSSDYHTVEGGHVRIYPGWLVAGRLRAAGFVVDGRHHAHALHSPYWWLRCALGDSAIPRLYHRMLVWDIMRKPFVTRALESGLNPVLGKSLVVYCTKPC